MSKFAVLGLAAALSVAALGAGPCVAWPKPAPGTTCAAYTPAKGSATRKMIADAMRRSLGAKTSIYAVFNFEWIKVNGSWAYAETRPESPDGESRYEPVQALLRRTNGVWRVRVLIMGDEESSPQQQLRAARRRNPSAPRDIFP